MRTPKTPAEKALDRLRTKAWIHGVREAAAERDRLPADVSFGRLEIAVAKKHGGLASFLGSKLLTKYANGTRTPTPATLSRFESVYRGTRAIFDEGPDGSHIWRAVACRDAGSAAVALFRLKSEIQSGVPAQIPIRARRGRPRFANVLIPAPLARRLKLLDLPLAARSATLKKLVKQHPGLRESLAWVIREEAAVGERGPLLSPRPEISFNADERRRQGAVVPPVLSGLSIQLLRAVCAGERTVIGGFRGLAVELRLRFDFGLQDRDLKDLADLMDFCATSAEPGARLGTNGLNRRHHPQLRRHRRLAHTS